MVEAAPADKIEERTQSTPESEKPRVQLELKSNKGSSPPMAKQLINNNKEQHLDLLKQTVAHLENHEGGAEQSSNAGQPASGSADNGANATTVDAE